MVIPDPPLDALLQSLVFALHYVPATARRLNSIDELPAHLRARALAYRTWQAWSDDTCVRFVCAHRVPGRPHPTVLAEFFDMDGRMVCAGVWRQNRSARWVLDAPVNHSSDRAFTP